VLYTVTLSLRRAVFRYSTSENVVTVKSGSEVSVYTRKQILLHGFTYSGVYAAFSLFSVIMRPSSLGGGRILRSTLSVRLSVRPVRGSSFVIVYITTVLRAVLSKIEKLLFSLMAQRHVCSFQGQSHSRSSKPTRIDPTPDIL